MHDSLRSFSTIFHAVANNSNPFPCLEIINVFNFRMGARTRKFFCSKIFGHENFRIYGSLTYVLIIQLYADNVGLHVIAAD